MADPWGADVPTDTIGKNDPWSADVPTEDWGAKEKARQTALSASLHPMETAAAMQAADLLSPMVHPQITAQNPEIVSKEMYGAPVKATGFLEKIKNGFRNAGIDHTLNDLYAREAVGSGSAQDREDIDRLKRDQAPPDKTIQGFPKFVLDFLYTNGYALPASMGGQEEALVKGTAAGIGNALLNRLSSPGTNMVREMMRQGLGAHYRSALEAGINQKDARIVGFVLTGIDTAINAVGGKGASKVGTEVVERGITRTLLSPDLARTVAKGIAGQGAYNYGMAVANIAVTNIAKAAEGKPTDQFSDMLKDLVKQGTPGMIVGTAMVAGHVAGNLLPRIVEDATNKSLGVSAGEGEPSLQPVPPGEPVDPNSGILPTQAQRSLVESPPNAQEPSPVTTVVNPVQPEGKPPFRSEEKFPIDQIKPHPEIPNYKEKFTPLQGEFVRPGLAPIVLLEAKDGNTYIITGRHRLDLAKRSGETTIPAHVFKESQGFTTKMARVWDAESNIRDNQGSTRDVANYFRETGITEEQASSRGLLRNAKGRNGFALGSYASDELYAGYRNQVIGEDRAAAIARGAPRDSVVQTEAMKASGVPADQLEQYTQGLLEEKLRQEAGGQAVQTDLFGFSSEFSDMLVKEAQAASRITRRMKDELADLSAAKKVSGPERQERLQKYGTINMDSSQIDSRISELTDQMQKMSGWRQDRELHNQVRAEAGLPAMEYTVAPQVKPATQEQQNDLFMAAQNEPLPEKAPPAPAGEMVLRDSAGDPVGPRQDKNVIYIGDTPVDRGAFETNALAGMTRPATSRKRLASGASPTQRTAIRRLIGRGRGTAIVAAWGPDAAAEMVAGGKNEMYRAGMGEAIKAQESVRPMAHDLTDDVLVKWAKENKMGPMKLGHFAMEEMTINEEKTIVPRKAGQPAPRTLNVGEILSAWLHFQDEDNKASLLRGQVIRRAENPTETLSHPITEGEFRQFFNKLFDKYPAVENMLSRAQTALERMGQVRADDYQKRHASPMEIRQKYWRKLVARTPDNQEMSIEDLQNVERWMKVTPDESHSIARQDVVVPIYLENFFKEFPETAYDTSLIVNMAGPLEQAGKVWWSKNISDRIVATHGHAMLQMFRNEMMRMAGRDNAPDGWMKVFDYLRDMTIPMNLGINPKQGPKQILLAIRSWPYVRTDAWLAAVLETTIHPLSTRKFAAATGKIYSEALRTGGTIETERMLRDQTKFRRAGFVGVLQDIKRTARHAGMWFTKAGANESFKKDNIAAHKGTAVELARAERGGKFSDDFKAATGLTEEQVRKNPLSPEDKMRYGGMFADYITRETHATGYSASQPGILKNPISRLATTFKVEAIKAGEAWGRAIMQARRNPTPQNIAKAAKSTFVYFVAEPLAFFAVDFAYNTLLDRRNKKGKSLSPPVKDLAGGDPRAWKDVGMGLVHMAAITYGNYVLGAGDVVQGVADRLQYGTAASSAGVNVSGQIPGYLIDGAVAAMKLSMGHLHGVAEVRAKDQFWKSAATLMLAQSDIPYQSPAAIVDSLWKRINK